MLYIVEQVVVVGEKVVVVVEQVVVVVDRHLTSEVIDIKSNFGTG